MQLKYSELKMKNQEETSEPTRAKQKNTKRGARKGGKTAKEMDIE